VCNEISLLSGREMKLLFPEADIIAEHLAGLPKSLIAVSTYCTLGGVNNE
jgi:hypothetical protein